MKNEGTPLYTNPPNPYVPYNSRTLPTVQAVNKLPEKRLHLTIKLLRLDCDKTLVILWRCHWVRRTRFETYTEKEDWYTTVQQDCNKEQKWKGKLVRKFEELRKQTGIVNNFLNNPGWTYNKRSKIHRNNRITYGCRWK